ncbi:MAG TPA: alanine racemase [Bryobacteraceae bacterium]|nr:alanine racemase [Bryobacteraceae bacterium]
MNPYLVQDAGRILTPALLVFPDIVEANIQATLRMMEGDPDRWRPHIKTAKIASIVARMIANGIRQFKCATTLELLTACEAGADDVLLAFPVTGANARRVIGIAQQFPNVRISVLIESAEQAAAWTGTPAGVFIDVNPGMNRTGIGQDRLRDIVALAESLGPAFRGVHYYDGHVSATDPASAHAGYNQLLEIVRALTDAGRSPREVITSGTPASPAALSHPGLRAAPFRHRISPGTVVYNDMSSLKQLPGRGYEAAVVVLATVISHPGPNLFTCDAGHKAVSADAGVPTCEVVGHPDFAPQKPSEEHLPIAVPEGSALPPIGSQLYLIPRHVCPTVNNFDDALMVIDGKVQRQERVTARGHESGWR